MWDKCLDQDLFSCKLQCVDVCHPSHGCKQNYTRLHFKWSEKRHEDQEKMSFLVHASHHQPAPLIQNNNLVIPDHNNPFHSCGNPCLFHCTALPPFIHCSPFFLSVLHFIFSPSLRLFACCSAFHLSQGVHSPLQVSVNLWLKVSLLSLNRLEEDSD